jgi:hypothetical protein
MILLILCAPGRKPPVYEVLRTLWSSVLDADVAEADPNVRFLSDVRPGD